MFIYILFTYLGLVVSNYLFIIICFSWVSFSSRFLVSTQNDAFPKGEHQRLLKYAVLFSEAIFLLPDKLTTQCSLKPLEHPLNLPDTWEKDYVQNSNCAFLKMSSENKSFIVEIKQNSWSNNADPTKQKKSEKLNHVAP